MAESNHGYSSAVDAKFQSRCAESNRLTSVDHNAGYRVWFDAYDTAICATWNIDGARIRVKLFDQSYHSANLFASLTDALEWAADKRDVK